MTPQAPHIGKQMKIFSPSNDFGVGAVYNLWSAYVSNPGTITVIQATPRGYVEMAIPKPLTIQGFVTLAFENGLNVAPLFRSGAKLDEEYGGLVEYIRNYIASEQIAGALVGNMNAGLVMRLNSIKENIEIQTISELPILKID